MLAQVYAGGAGFVCALLSVIIISVLLLKKIHARHMETVVCSLHHFKSFAKLSRMCMVVIQLTAYNNYASFPLRYILYDENLYRVRKIENITTLQS